jgi:hypothetical protein
MRLPIRMPTRPSVEDHAVPSRAKPGPANTPSAGLSQAACCAEACVNVPFVGRVCHCVLDLPICP